MKKAIVTLLILIVLCASIVLADGPFVVKYQSVETGKFTPGSEHVVEVRPGGEQIVASSNIQVPHLSEYSHRGLVDSLQRPKEIGSEANGLLSGPAWGSRWRELPFRATMQSSTEPNNRARLGYEYATVQYPFEWRDSPTRTQALRNPFSVWNFQIHPEIVKEKVLPPNSDIEWAYDAPPETFDTTYTHPTREYLPSGRGFTENHPVAFQSPGIQTYENAWQKSQVRTQALDQKNAWANREPAFSEEQLTLTQPAEKKGEAKQLTFWD